MHGSALLETGLGTTKTPRRSRRPGSTHSRNEPPGCGKPAVKEFSSSSPAVASILSEFAGDGQSHISTLLRSKSLERQSKQQRSFDQLPQFHQSQPLQKHQQPRYSHQEDYSANPIELAGSRKRSQSVGESHGLTFGGNPFLFDPKFLKQQSPANAANFEAMLQSLSKDNGNFPIHLHRETSLPEGINQSQDLSMVSLMSSGRIGDANDEHAHSSSSSYISNTDSFSGDSSVDSFPPLDSDDDEDSCLEDNDDASLDETSCEETLNEWESVQPPPVYADSEDDTDDDVSQVTESSQQGDSKKMMDTANPRLSEVRSPLTGSTETPLPTTSTPKSHSTKTTISTTTTSNDHQQDNEDKDDDNHSSSSHSRRRRRPQTRKVRTKQGLRPTSDHVAICRKKSPRPRSFVSDHGGTSMSKSRNGLASWSDCLARSRNLRRGHIRRSPSNERHPEQEP